MKYKNNQYMKLTKKICGLIQPQWSMQMLQYNGDI